MLADELGVDTLDILTNLLGLDGELVVDEFNMLCPHPKHQDTNPSCNVNTVTGKWHCWSCDARGDLITLVQHITGKKFIQARRMLAPDNVDAARDRLQRRLRGLQKPAGAVVHPPRPEDRPWLPTDAREPHSYRGRCPDLERYMLDRGFEPATLAAWGVRYVRFAEVATKRRKVEIRNSIAIPLLDKTGAVQAWTYRATPASLDWQPKYLDTKDAPVGQFWHGEHFNHSEDEVVVAEGPPDGMMIHQAGFPAYTSMGNQMPLAKVMALANFRRITLFYDRDVAGMTATAKLGEVLWRHTSVYVARYPKVAQGSDPGELSSLDIELAIANRTPWTSWALRERLATHAEAR